MPQDNGHYWDTMSKYEAEQFLHGIDLGASHPARLAVYKWLKDNADKSDTVLDIPSGSGVDAKGISEVCKYVGMDRTDVVIEAAQSNNQGVKFLKGDILNNPSQNGEFEWVQARAIFEHLANIEDVETAMRECYRVASKGCVFAFFLPPQERADPKIHTPKRVLAPIRKLQAWLRKQLHPALRS